MLINYKIDYFLCEKSNIFKDFGFKTVLFKTVVFKTSFMIFKKKNDNISYKIRIEHCNQKIAVVAKLDTFLPTKACFLENIFITL